MSAINLGTKRGVLRPHISSWERNLPLEDVRELQTLRDAVSELEVLFENLHTDLLLRELSIARVKLERRITSLQKKSLDAVVESKRKQAQDHSLAWKVFNSMEDEQSSIPTPPTTLVDHFENVMAPKSCPAAAIFLPFHPLEGPVTQNDSPVVAPFSSDELHDAISKINMDSAPGPDGVTPSLAKDLFAFLPFFLTFLTFVNFCFSNSWTPDDWQTSVIFILYKGKGDPLSPDSYRGISMFDTRESVREAFVESPHVLVEINFAV
jgi:hypothetical protein